MPSLVLVLLLLALCALLAVAKPPADLPAAEQALADTVDPWGLPFSDQLNRFRARFADRPDARFSVGFAHGLVKVWPNKYWFRGPASPQAPGFVAGAPSGQAPEQWGVTVSTLSFQIAILPRVGAPEATYRVSATAGGFAGVDVWREVFVTTAHPAYPRFETDRWPDPLVPDKEVTLSGTEAGVFWVDVRLPSDAPPRFDCLLEVTDGQQTCKLSVPINVVSLLRGDPHAYPLVAWFRDTWSPQNKKLTPEQFRGMCALVLGHHMQPIDALSGAWDPKQPQDFARFDDLFQFLLQRDQRIFQLPGADKPEFQALYDHVKQRGWLKHCVIYSNADEPLAETFQKENIPFCQEMHKKCPGLRIYLASEYHPNMEQGCDLWMTDLSSSQYDPQNMRNLEAPELWHYYCHLPVHWQARAPLVFAPNMEIDNPALEHRLALWMSRYYGAKGVFIWAGFCAGDLPADFWQALKLDDKPSGFPYGGVHNGNNFRVYPPREEGGPVLPSIRLKVTRDGMEDLALFAACEGLLAEGRIKGKRAEELRKLLDPTPEVFMHTHHWDHLPETLLARREAILKLLAERP